MKKGNVRVTVLEGTQMLGGISQTAQYKGYRFDIGGHRFFTKVEPVEALWHEILGPEFIQVPRQSRIHYRAGFKPIASHVVECAGEGVTNADLSVYDYRRLVRPIYPLDAQATR